MKLPFTFEQFISVFADYNVSVYPMQIFLNFLAIYIIIFLFVKTKLSNQVILFVLGFLWLWTGIVYHILFFSSINKAAYFFGSLFVVQGALFILNGIKKKKYDFHFEKNYFGIIGLIMILYALFIYPLLGHYLGHSYPNNPTFGAPCPITIFTFGILLLNNKKTPVYLIIIPLIWGFMGLSAAVNLKIYEDFGLIFAAVIGTTLIVLKNRTKKQN